MPVRKAIRALRLHMPQFGLWDLAQPLKLVTQLVEAV